LTMLSSSMLKEEVEVIVDLLAHTKTEEAKQRLTHLVPQVSSEYGRGALLALNGVLNVIENKAMEKIADPEKIVRVADRVPKLHMLDDLDKGYLQTISKWAKKVKAQGPQAAKDSPPRE
jgi:hypothetical protein